MGVYVKFTKTTEQIWSCHVTLASNSENFYFSPNFILNFRKSYQIWGKLALEQKSYRQKQIGRWKTPAYRVKQYITPEKDFPDAFAGISEVLICLVLQIGEGKADVTFWGRS